MMYWLLVLVFVIGYLFIALEHSIKIDKAATAILTGVVCWTILIVCRDAFHFQEAGSEVQHTGTLHFLDEKLLSHVGEIAEILFFLLAAMTIVELIDAHKGFQVMTDRISTTHRVKMMWIICGISFFFSAALDNLTTSIVMAALLKKLIRKKRDLMYFGGMVIIAANAGGAWSPIGDVTTIMLWIGSQITALTVITQVFIPSVVCLLVPLTILTFQMKGEVRRPAVIASQLTAHQQISNFEQHFVFWLGVGGLLFVPVFKSITHMPPFMGMLLSLGFIWVITEIIHRKKHHNSKSGLLVADVIRRIDTPTILFFLGILLAVSSLQTAGHLADFARVLDNSFANIYLINLLIGLLSAIVDNVPLVAGAMGMYPLDIYPQDHPFWLLLAYCAGTGGSSLIIGSAAGVAIMGLLKIDFIWYMKNIAWLAILGYLSGLLVMYLLR